MFPAQQQILTLYEVEQLTPEQIASELEWSVTAVKAVLAGYSTEYRTKNKQETLTPEEDITDEESKQIMQRLKQIALNSEDENVVVRVGRWLFNEKKGRNNIQDLGNGVKGVNVLILNQQLQAANGAVEKALLGTGSKEDLRQTNNVITLEAAECK